MSASFVSVDCIDCVGGEPVSVARPARRPCKVEGGLAGGSGGVRLTRRGRLALLVVVLGLAFGALTLLSGPAASTRDAHHSPSRTVVVEPGETLWDIAASTAPGEDPRKVVAEIVDLNSLTDPGAIRAGQPLYIPAR